MRAERLIAILMALQRAQALTAGELAQRLSVSVRTIFRDVDALSTMGVPVYTEQGRGGGIRLVDKVEITHVYGRDEAYEAIRRSQADYTAAFMGVR